MDPYLPIAVDVAGVLSKLFNKKVSAEPAPLLRVDQPLFVAAYECGPTPLSNLWLCSLELAASLGAALTGIPPGAAADAVKAKRLTDDMRDNVREVANVCANSFRTRRVRLTHFWSPGEALPEPVAKLSQAPGGRVDAAFTIAGYHGGRLSFFAA